MLRQFEQYEIENIKVIFGGGPGDDKPIPLPNPSLPSFPFPLIPPSGE